jgi:hypothetical protein
LASSQFSIYLISAFSVCRQLGEELAIKLGEEITQLFDVCSPAHLPRASELLENGAGVAVASRSLHACLHRDLQVLNRISMAHFEDFLELLTQYHSKEETIKLRRLITSVRRMCPRPIVPTVVDLTAD